jgi:hypothetical protein
MIRGLCPIFACLTACAVDFVLQRRVNEAHALLSRQ